MIYQKQKNRFRPHQKNGHKQSQKPKQNLTSTHQPTQTHGHPKSTKKWAADGEWARKNNTTFDPRIHHKVKGKPGFGLKRDYVPANGENSGSTLKHLFDNWSKDK